MAESKKLYMQSPLVLWVETFKANDGHPLEYQDLFDGVFLNDVMQQIDTRSAYDNVNRCVEDVSVRLHNWDILLRNIRGFYSDILQQLLIMRLPNINIICREPGKDVSFAEVRRALLLILGCAVQCEQKETFIDKIMSMDITAQTELVENIKEVTDSCETILPIQRPETPTSSNSYMDKVFHHLYRLIQERDEYAEQAAELGQERDYYMSQAEGRLVVDAPQISPDRHHLALELAECKANLRHVRQELEDRQEHLSDLKDELQESLAICAQLKNENALLVQEARATRLLRDELDIMKEKAAKVDMFEKEILKYKERMNEFEFYKARTVELKEDNAILEETKAMLEDQLANSRKRIETVTELESELGKYRQQIEELSRDRDLDREKIEYLTEENAQLEFQRKTSMNESTCLETELSAARSGIGDIGKSLSEQLSETSHTRILRLELENQRLTLAVAKMKKNTLAKNAEMSLEFEMEKQKLSKKVKELQSSASDSSEQVIQIESELSATRDEKDKLKKALDIANEKSEQHVHELEREIEELSQSLHQFRDRSEKSNDLKVKDLERENKRLHETITAKNLQLSKLEDDIRQLQRSSQQLDDLTQKVPDLEREKQVLEKENADLHQKVATLQHTADRLESIEHKNSDLSLENRKLQKTVETFQAASERKEQLEQDYISLTQDHQRLQRLLETLKAGSDRAVELESEKDDLNKELQQLRKLLEGQKAQKLKQEQMEFEIIDLGNENQRLQKSLEVTMRRLHQLEEDNMDIETDNEKISKELETLKVTNKQLENKEMEASQLEAEVQQLQKVNAALEKENRKLKQSSDLKDSSLETMNVQFMSLNQENKALRQSMLKMKELCNKGKDLEKENRELLQELNADRRTLTALREDLVNEKIRSQEISNELDQLTGELEKVGIDTEKLTMAEQTKDANHYKALETMIEETLKKSSELKEEKIRALESRLEESKSRNLKLQEDLIEARRENEVLKQRLEEEELVVKDVVAGRKSENESFVKSASSNATQDILQLKDHLVELERQNATLIAEIDNLRSNNQNITEQCHKLDTQLSNFHCQHAVLQGQYSSLREQNAKLQVEYTTLQTQTNSALSQQDLLKNQLSQLEAQHENLSHKHKHLLNTRQSIISDHEALQNLHEQLTAEYESLVSEHNCLRSLHKSLKIEIEDLQNQVKVLLQNKDDVNRLHDVLEDEREQMKKELTSLGNLQSNYQNLQGEHSQLTSVFDKLSKDYNDVLTSNKQIKTDYNNLQQKTAELQEELTEAKENILIADMEFEKLENKMETVYHINERIENENQALLMQIKQLLNQNQELLTQALNSKDHFAEEEKAYLEKLSELRRQKERLEEKIMESYKNRLSPKKKGLGALIARKARGIISRGPKRSKSKNNLSEVLDNSSQESGSTEPVNDGHQILDDNTSLLSAVSSFVTGAKSTEDMIAIASIKGTHPPVFGQPSAISDVETCPGEKAVIQRIGINSSPGFRPAGRNSRDNSFVNEKWLEPIHCQLSNDSESRNSEHSSAGSDKHSHQLQLQQHFQDSMSQNQPHDSGLAASSLMSQAVCEISHHSLGSDSETSSIGSGGLRSHQMVYASTPKSDNEASPMRMQSNLGSRCSSSELGDKSLKECGLKMTQICSSQIGQKDSRHEPPANLKCGDEQTFPLGIQTFAIPSSQSTPSHLLHHPLSQSIYHPLKTYKKQGREHRPPPAYPPPPIPTTDRLSTSVSDGDESVHYSQPYGQPFSGASHLDHIWHRDRRNQSNSTDMGKESRGTSASQKVDGSVTSGLITPSALTHSMPNQSSPLHDAPVSTVDQSSRIRSIYSRPPGEIRPRQQQQGKSSDRAHKTNFSNNSGGHMQVEKNVNNCNSNYKQPHFTERPKSVPPHLFYEEDRHNNRERDLSAPPRGTSRDVVEIVSRNFVREAPVGRDPRETQSFSNIDLNREPVWSSSQSQSSRQFYLNQPQPYYHQYEQQHHNDYPSNIDFISPGSRSIASSHVPATQASHYQSNNLLDARPGLVNQLSSLRLDSTTLSHQDQVSPRPGQQQNKQHPDINLGASQQSSPFCRSQSSTGNIPSNATSSGFAPRAPYSKSCTPERWNQPPNQHNMDIQLGLSDHQQDLGFQNAGYPLGSSSNHHRESYGMKRNSTQNPGSCEPRELPVPFFSEECPFSPQQQSTSNSYCSKTLPSQHSHFQRPSQYIRECGSSKSDNISPKPGGQVGGLPSHQTSYQQQVISQGRPPSSSYINNVPSHKPAVWNQVSPDNTTDLPSLPSNTSHISSQSQTPQIPPTLEREIKEEQTTNTNSIWYEYGCV